MFRRAKSLISYWTDDGLRLRNYVRGTALTVRAGELEILNASSSWLRRDELDGDALGLDESAADAAIRRLLDAGMLESVDQPADARELALDSWEQWMPSAAFFHLDTRDVRFEMPSKTDVNTDRRLSIDPPPPRPVSEEPDIFLPAIPRRGAIPSVLLQRRSWRSYGKRPLALSELSTLLGLTWGTQLWIHPRDGIRFPMKTSPSGGACHSLEAYVLVRSVRGLEAGVYRYLSDAHGLVRIGEPWTDEDLVTRLAHQDWTTGLSAIVFLASRFDRVQWKYPSPRAYRTVLLEAGHFCQSFCLVATWQGLAPFCTAAFADSLIDTQLGLDGVNEAVLYVMGVGSRPPGSGRTLVPDANMPTSQPAHRKRSRVPARRRRSVS